MSDSVTTRALVRAIVEAQRAVGHGWSKPNKESADPNLQRLIQELQRLRAGAPRKSQIRHLLRWVGDWVPDPESPLMNALGELERSMPDDDGRL